MLATVSRRCPILAEKYPGISPYSYCAGNPINFVDPDGKRIWTVNATGRLVSSSDNEDYDQVRMVDIDGRLINTSSKYATNTLFTRGEDGLYLDLWTSDELVGMDLFLFLAGNSSTEYGYISSTSYLTDENLSRIFTDGYEGEIDLGRRASDFPGSSYLSFILHSHPNDGPPSGFSGRIMGDHSMSKVLQNNLDSQTIQMVYRVKSMVFDRYDNTRNAIFDKYVYDKGNWMYLGKEKVFYE